MTWNGMPRLALIIALALVLVVSALLGTLWFAQRSFIYLPNTSSPTVPDDAVEVLLRTEDGLELSAWRIDPVGADRSAAVLVAPGNAGNRTGGMPLAGALAGEGFTVLLFDYRGYGGNPGSPTEDGLYADARAAWIYLTDEAGFEPDRIVLFGESLGTGVATRLATEVEPACIVLRSPFTSMADAGRSHMPFVPVGMLLKDRYPVTEYLSESSVPVLVAYAPDDQVVPAEQSIEVATAAEGLGVEVTAVEIDAFGHEDPELVSGPLLIDGIVTLADGLGLK
ncbi:alpha/beta fold hydrolase [Glycomyces sp. L485]|uniref:alpha/beta hydrolase n=1 Tax=Glycomyces sp. L485 TaxID=2909235 RepID=UPI001F4B03E3|nr:alpha/beta fold hydrolase [Glycomyces sp. L485]MCH7231077.1 alpha/beta fold hydrolase [Glycomyces sp. L485]